MPKRVDLTGQQFGKLTVLEKAGKMNGKTHWYCECSCGTWTMPTTSNLRSGSTKSCGCHKRETTRELGKKNLKHGGSGLVVDGKRKPLTPEYQAWHSFRHVRKTEFVPEWEDFQQFFKDMGWRPSAEHELARHDIRKPHGPTNTYWRNTQDEIRERKQLGMPVDLSIDSTGILLNARAAAAATA